MTALADLLSKYNSPADESEGMGASIGSDGQVEIWLDRAVVDRLRALSEPGEGYSDVIIRLAKG